MDSLRTALIAVAATACAAPDSGSCLDQAEWQVALDHPTRTESSLTVTPDSVVVAIGNLTLDDVHVASETIHGAHLLRLGLDGTVLDLVPTPEGDGMSPARITSDEHGNVYVAWTAGDHSAVASYGPDLQRRWYFESPDTVLSFDTDRFGYSALLTKEPNQSHGLFYIEPTGSVRWAVDAYNTTQVIVALNEDVLAWAVGTTGSTRYRFDQISGFDETPSAYDSPASVLYRDGGYVSSDGTRMVRVGTAGDELWSRDFEANIGIPIVTAEGDVLLPAATGSREDLPYVIVLIDGLQGFTKAVRARCARTILWAADSATYYGIGDGGDHPGSIAAFPLR